LEGEPGRAPQLLARVALAQGDLAQAEQEARVSMADAASSSEGAVILAQVYVRRSDPAHALQVLEDARRQALEQKRAPSPALDDMRGDVLGRLGRLREAEAVFREQIKTFPERPQAYASLAVVPALEPPPRPQAAHRPPPL